MDHPADYFARPEDAVRHGIVNPRARRASEELRAVRGARVVAGRCTLADVIFILSNGVGLRFHVQGGPVEWEMTPSEPAADQPVAAMAPVVLRTPYGECILDPEQQLAACIGREILNLTADLSHAQLLLAGLPLGFFPYTARVTGEPVLSWFDLREPEERAIGVPDV
jgi:hypothetical protein